MGPTALSASAASSVSLPPRGPGEGARAPGPWPLACLALVDLARQLWLVERAWEVNPLVRVPLGDGLYFLDTASRIAAGELVSDTPFLTAPLYPWLLAGLLWLGLGLRGIFACQALLHALTLWLVGRVARRRWGPWKGLVPPLLFLLLADAAEVSPRLSNSSVQLATAALALHELAGLCAASRRARAGRAGASLGLAVLAQPALLPAIPGLALWARAALGRGKAAPLLAGALVVLAPAAIHNALACGELILVSAQSGVTFAHGNAPGARGTYHLIDGVSHLKVRQDRDALALARAELGREVGWVEADRHFLARGLRYWASEPFAAARLAARKVWWTLSARNYGESFLPRLEREAGLAPLAPLSPLPLAWILPFACAAGLLSAGDWRRRLPDQLLALLPLATCVVFYYSSRYRLPAAPALVLLTGTGLFELLPTGRRGARAVLLAAAALGLASGAMNQRAGFDSVEAYRGEFEATLGAALVEEGDLEGALARFQASLALGNGAVRGVLGETLRRVDRREEALAVLRAAPSGEALDLDVERTLAVVLAELGRPAEAREHFEAALARDPRHPATLSGLGNVLLALGDPQGALELHERALALAPGDVVVLHGHAAALAAAGRHGEAIGKWNEVLAREPAFAPARWALIGQHAAARRYREVLELCARGVQLDPTDLALAHRYAWFLAVVPDPALRDPERALAIALELQESGGGERSEALHVQAAALAALGRFEEAARAAERARALAEAEGDRAFAAELARCAAQYRAGQAYVLP
jgi:tetratricopeptide (TPR) repeat protein